MIGKQAKVLTQQHIGELLTYAAQSRYPERNRVIALLSVKAGLRAGEIAKATWEMLLAADGSISRTLELRDHAAKKGSGRRIPLHKDLRAALGELLIWSTPEGPIVRSERGGRMTPASVVNWFAEAYRALNLIGCSSHSGRRTFITRAARSIHRAGGSLRDVQMLAGHRSIETTQRYIDGDTDAQRKLVALI
jgi:integrase/recombinase XerD